ncbi:MAG: RluA family pseudouridine synthase [Deltaproteobacteria bacterium]|nr:RluA family pseudouridine synthase [Deltaproteobacteria bacterium]
MEIINLSPFPRLDRFLGEQFPQVSTNRWRQVLLSGKILVDGRRGVKGDSLAAGQKVLVPEDILACLVADQPEPETEPEVEIICQNEDFLALNKPAGCHTHPLSISETGTLANHLISIFPELVGVGDFGPLQPGLLHRLDFATSGVVLVARNNSAWDKLREEFKRHLIRKEYLAQVQGRIEDDIVIDKALTHDAGDLRRMLITPPATLCRGLYPARTEVFPISYDAAEASTLVRLVMYSGVMHQLRVHLADSGHPLVDDSLYGGGGLAGVEAGDVTDDSSIAFHLHCFKITLSDGRTISAPLPEWCETGA